MKTQLSVKDLITVIGRWDEVSPIVVTDRFNEFELYAGAGYHRLLYLVHEGLMTEAMTDRLRLLLSPHYVAIIKVWKIQRSEV